MDPQSFYTERHRQESDYAGGTYDLAPLLGLPPVGRWMAGRAGATVRSADVGCGKAVFLRDFLLAVQRRGLSPEAAVGFDIVESEGHVFADIPGGFTLRTADLNQPPLPGEDGEFDLVICNHVLEHVFHTEALLRDLRRLVQSEGRVLVSVPNVAAWVNRLLFLFGVQPLGSEVGTESITYGFRPARGKAHLGTFIPSGHIRDFTPLGLKDLVEACGFAVEGWWNQDERPWLRLTRWSGRGMGVWLRPV